MMDEEPIWFNYMIFDRDGVKELLPDTPQHIREEFEDYLALRKAHPDVRF